MATVTSRRFGGYGLLFFPRYSVCLYFRVRSSIRRSLPQSVFQSLVAALVLTKLDFGNAALADISSFQLDRLQAVMNAATPLVVQSSRYDHITPLLYNLHWLCAPEIITYKLAVLVYDCVHAYLADTLYSLSLDFLVDNASVHHRPRHWSYHWHGSLRSATERSSSPPASTWNSDVIRSDVIKLSPIIQDWTQDPSVSASFP